jgi:F0F1-type ATP synthase membrane subunit a
MLAGDILIKLFISLCLDFYSISWILFFSGFFLICILMSLEVFISFLQAYIFMLLSLLYLDDVLNGSH